MHASLVTLTTALFLTIPSLANASASAEPSQINTGDPCVEACKKAPDIDEFGYDFRYEDGREGFQWTPEELEARKAALSCVEKGRSMVTRSFKNFAAWTCAVVGIETPHALQSCHKKCEEILDTFTRFINPDLPLKPAVQPSTEGAPAAAEPTPAAPAERVTFPPVAPPARLAGPIPQGTKDPNPDAGIVGRQ